MTEEKNRDGRPSRLSFLKAPGVPKWTAVFLGWLLVPPATAVSYLAFFREDGLAPAIALAAGSLATAAGILATLYRLGVRRRRGLQALLEKAERLAAGNFSRTDEDRTEQGLEEISAWILRLAVSTESLKSSVKTEIDSLLDGVEIWSRVGALKDIQPGFALGRLEDAIGSLNELRKASEGAARGADLVSAAAERARALIVEGRETMEQSRAQMEIIQAVNIETTREIGLLSRSVKEIIDVADLIGDIADQTRLIAFNASIEAASAAAGNRRFGVVAREIRGLADKVARTVEDLRLKIGDIQQRVNELVIASEDWTKKIDLGKRLSKESHQIFEAIGDGIGELSENCEDIRTAAALAENSREKVNRILDEISKAETFSSKGFAEAGKLAERIGKFIDVIGDKLEKKSE